MENPHPNLDDEPADHMVLIPFHSSGNAHRKLHYTFSELCETVFPLQ
jgi:hypothetical protein